MCRHKSAILFLGLFFGATTLAQPPVKSTAAQMPHCVRPTDFSQGRLVQSYEDCERRISAFCDDNEKSPECLRWSASLHHKRITREDDPDPTARCAVQRDGSYKCIQDPLRFTGGDEPVEQTPTTATVPVEGGATGKPGTDTSPAPGTPTAGAPSTTLPPGAPNPPVVMPPPPQK